MRLSSTQERKRTLNRSSTELITHTSTFCLQVPCWQDSTSPIRKSGRRPTFNLSLIDAVSQLRPQYDYIVFDCPPRLSLVSFTALCASDAVIIPMEAADWGAQGIMQVTEAIHYVQKHYNSRLQLLGYLVSRFRRARALPAELLEAASLPFRRPCL